MLTVVTWLWSQPGFRTRYTPEIVLEMRDMVKRFYKKPHRFVCVTDQRIDGVETVRLKGGCFQNLRIPTWENGPSCYRRLIAFKKDADSGHHLVSHSAGQDFSRSRIRLSRMLERFNECGIAHGLCVLFKSWLSAFTSSTGLMSIFSSSFIVLTARVYSSRHYLIFKPHRLCDVHEE